MSQFNRKRSHAPKYSAIALAVLCAFSLQPKPAAARDGGVIAGAVIGGIAAAVIAGQIANAARHPGVRTYSPRPRHVRASKKEKATANKENAAAENKEHSDPFAGVVPTVDTRVRGQ